MSHADRADEYERIARETTWQVVTRLAEDATVAAEEAASAVYWDDDLDAEQIERLRQVVFDLRYATEEYLARFCDETDPWSDAPSWHPNAESRADDAGRTPSWHPTAETPPWHSDERTD